MSMLLPGRSAWSRRLCALIVVAALLLRAAYLFLFVDHSRDYYWEYGEIGKNLHMGKGYSLFYYEGTKVEFHASPSVTPFPSAYMMPGYVALLYPFLCIDHVALRNVLLLLFQALLGAGSAVFMFRFVDRFIGRREAFVAAAILAVLPEFVFATGSYTPTVLFHFLFLAALPVLYLLRGPGSLRLEVAAGILLALILYIRPDLALFTALFVAFLFFAGRRPAAVRVTLVMVVLMLPWQIRNAVVFREWLPFTTSEGLNFFRGHNEAELGSWGDEETIEGLRHLPPGKDFEPEMSRMFSRRALAVIAAEPGHELSRTALKLEQLWFRDRSDPRSANLLYLAPWILLLVSAAVGVVVREARKAHTILLLYLACSTAVAVIFFVLPRYQTMMKVALIPFSAIGTVWLWDRVRSNTLRQKSDVLR